jgi:ABC-type transporter Mla maintaining outer membrane lipid asymmetry ATPase subunit MlaF
MTPGQINQRVNLVADMTGLAPVVQRRTRAIAGNWHSRVGLARALALKPEILFLDEPISGLELDHGRWWLDFLSRLLAGAAGDGGQGVTLVVATNNIDPWAAQGRQFAMVRGHRWHVLGGRDELKGAEAALAESEPAAVPKPVP